jgi:hypothetical protein
MQFNYDWWFGASYAERIEVAKRRCANNHFPDVASSAADADPAYTAFFNQLEGRTIIYLRDGFSYEIKELIKHPTTSSLTFECMPSDEAYKVGCFVVTVPFDEIVRVEIFAVHPNEKPEDMPSIKGFGGAQPHSMPPAQRPDQRDRPQ